MRAVALVLGGGVLGLSAFAYYEQYFRWRGCFNELGRCYDSASGMVFLEQAGIVWALFAGVGALIALWGALPVLRSKAHKKTPR